MLNIVLKLHFDRYYTLQDITIFTFGPFGLQIGYSHPLFVGAITPK